MPQDTQPSPNHVILLNGAHRDEGASMDECKAKLAAMMKQWAARHAVPIVEGSDVCTPLVLVKFPDTCSVTVQIFGLRDHPSTFLTEINAYHRAYEERNAAKPPAPRITIESHYQNGDLREVSITPADGRFATVMDMLAPALKAHGMSDAVQLQAQMRWHGSAASPARSHEGMVLNTNAPVWVGYKDKLIAAIGNVDRHISNNRDTDDASLAVAATFDPARLEIHGDHFLGAYHPFIHAVEESIKAYHNDWAHWGLATGADVSRYKVACAIEKRTPDDESHTLVITAANHAFSTIVSALQPLLERYSATIEYPEILRRLEKDAEREKAGAITRDAGRSVTAIDR